MTEIKEVNEMQHRDSAVRIKLVDTSEYVSTLRELTEEGHEVSMIVSGSSMSPFIIHQRDSITFKKPDRELRFGDFVFFQRSSGQYVCHRICKIKSEGYYIVGDAQTVIEGPIKREQIFGLIISVTRKGKRLAPGDFWWEFFEKIWPRIIPIRYPIVKLYSCFFQKRKWRSINL